MNYPVVEMFYSIQGEGPLAGSLAWFIRLAGCNLQCPFCDTDHLVQKMLGERELYFHDTKHVVITGGEPLLHDLRPIIRQYNGQAEVWIETNGTIDPRERVSPGTKIVMSPKRASNHLHEVDAVKVLYPYLPGLSAETILDTVEADWYGIQPLEGSDLRTAAEEVLRLGYPWRLSLQQHKIVGLR